MVCFFLFLFFFFGGGGECLGGTNCCIGCIECQEWCSKKKNMVCSGFMEGLVGWLYVTMSFLSDLCWSHGLWVVSRGFWLRLMFLWIFLAASW